MGKPENPNQIIIKNKFYPKGVKEIDIWNYYQMYKGPILNETRGRELAFVLMTDVNKSIIRRKTKNKKYITLTNSNYDNMIIGRLSAIYSTMKPYEDIGIVDIDIANFQMAKKAAITVMDMLEEFPFASETTCRYTGKESFHITCKFNRKYAINDIRDLLKDFLLVNKPEDYTVAVKRKPGVVNLDLSPNKYRGAFISLNSLSIWGLRCIEVPYNRIKTFQQSAAKIKIS